MPGINSVFIDWAYKEFYEEVISMGETKRIKFLDSRGSRSSGSGRDVQSPRRHQRPIIETSCFFQSFLS